MSFTCVTIFLALFSVAKTASINGSLSKTNLKEGDNVNVNVAFLFKEREELLLTKFSVNDFVIAQDAGSSFVCIDYAKLLFGNRVSCSASGLSYNIYFTSLRINDSMILNIELLYFVESAFQIVSTKIPITINADPAILSFPNMVFIEEGETLALETIIYGKPKPVGVVKFLGRIYNAKSSNEIHNNTYKFGYDLGQLTANDCGMVLILNVSGNGQLINTSSTVIVQFTPPMVREISVVQLSDFLVIVRWKPIYSGNCYVLYNVEFLNNANQVVDRFIEINGTEISALNSANSVMVKVNAVVNGTVGEYFVQRIPPPELTSTKYKATTECPLVLVPKSNLFGVGAAVGAAVSGIVIILVALVIYRIVICRRRAKKVETKVTENNNEDRDYQELHSVQKENYASYLTEDYVVPEIHRTR